MGSHFIDSLKIQGTTYTVFFHWKKKSNKETGNLQVTDFANFLGLCKEKKLSSSTTLGQGCFFERLTRWVEGFVFSPLVRTEREQKYSYELT